MLKILFHQFSSRILVFFLHTWCLKWSPPDRFETCAYLSPALKSSSLMWKVFSPLVELLEIHQPPVLLLSTVLFKASPPRASTTPVSCSWEDLSLSEGALLIGALACDELQRLECQRWMEIDFNHSKHISEGSKCVIQSGQWVTLCRSFLL